MKKKRAKSFRLGTCEIVIPELNEREKWIILEMFARNVGDLYGEEFEQRYEKACFEKLFRSEKKRRAFEFLRKLDNALALLREAGEAVTDPGLLKLIAAPVMDALQKRDVEFFEGLAQAVRVLKQREMSSKTNYAGSQDKWLLEYGLVNNWEKIHTAHELNEQFVSKIWRTTDDKLRRKCKSLGVPLKEDRRGPKTEIATPILKKKS